MTDVRLNPAQSVEPKDTTEDTTYCLLCGKVTSEWCMETRDGDHRHPLAENRGEQETPKYTPSIDRDTSVWHPRLCVAERCRLCGAGNSRLISPQLDTNYGYLSTPSLSGLASRQTRRSGAQCPFGVKPLSTSRTNSRRAMRPELRGPLCGQPLAHSCLAW